VVWAPVPEAAIDEHSQAGRGQNHIRCTWEVSPMNPESEPSGVKLATKRDLGSRR
jgi:hypothetical protein